MVVTVREQFDGRVRRKPDFVNLINRYRQLVPILKVVTAFGPAKLDSVAILRQQLCEQHILGNCLHDDGVFAAGCAALVGSRIFLPPPKTRFYSFSLSMSLRKCLPSRLMRQLKRAPSSHDHNCLGTAPRQRCGDPSSLSERYAYYKIQSHKPLLI